MEKEKVVLGMSGGVDSSVAAYLLQQQDYEVIGFFMNCNPHGTSKIPSSINWKKEELDLRKFCKKLKIELHILDCEVGYEKKVIGSMIKDYSRGLTPNPDTLCNKIGKFPKMLELAEKVGAKKIATGHYARVRKGKKGYELLRGKDYEKDQTYFLCDLNQRILNKVLFPIGELDKTEVRKIAHKLGFKNWNKRSSRGICYLGKIDVKAFLRSKIPEKKGIVISHEGKVVGTHPGIMYFTIGERVKDKSGFVINKEFRKKFGKKLFIVSKENGNRIVIAPEGNKLLKTKKLFITKFRWINNKNIEMVGLKGRIRHLGSLEKGKLYRKDSRWVWEFSRGQCGIAAGQNVVLYKNDKMIAVGEIRLR